MQQQDYCNTKTTNDGFSKCVLLSFMSSSHEWRQKEMTRIHVETSWHTEMTHSHQWRLSTHTTVCIKFQSSTMTTATVRPHALPTPCIETCDNSHHGVSFSLSLKRERDSLIILNKSITINVNNGIPSQYRRLSQHAYQYRDFYTKDFQLSTSYILGMDSSRGHYCWFLCTRSCFHHANALQPRASHDNVQ